METLVSGLLSEFENGRMSRRDLVRTLTVSVATATGVSAQAAAPASTFKAMSVNHISYGVADYAKSRDFYADLLGMPVHKDNGKQCILSFGPDASPSLLVLRKTRQPDNKPYVDHIAYAIANWDKEKVKAELDRRGLSPREDNNSWHVKDPDGFDIQIEADDAAEQAR
jgi:catechol 2,3-dioxygenase-like lactoylglutathione lyase family enzyme